MTEGAKKHLARMAIWRGPPDRSCAFGREVQPTWPGREGVWRGNYPDITFLSSLTSHGFLSLAEPNGKPKAKKPADTVHRGLPP